MESIADKVESVAEMFRKRVEYSGDLEAHRIKSNGRWQLTTWGTMGREVDATASGLSQLGVGPGSTVAILGETCPEWCLADLAAIVLGGRSVGIYPSLMEDQIQYILTDASAQTLFVQTQEHFQRVQPMLEAVDSLKNIIIWDQEPVELPGVIHFDDLKRMGANQTPPKVAMASDDVAVIVYTSGTTGQPKGVPLTHGNVLGHLRTGQALLPEPITEDDITLAFLPMAHVAEHVPGFFGRINLGLKAAYATNYDTVLDDLLDIRPTYFGAVPRIFEKMYGRIRERVAQATPRRQAIFAWAEELARKKTRADLNGAPFSLRDRFMYRLANRLVYRRIRDVFGGRVKTFITGAAPINVEILEFFHGVGMTILEVYGLSESTAIAFANIPGKIRHGTVGRALPGIDVKLAEDGEVLLRGETIFGGYLNLPAEDAFDEDGYFRTGDIGEIDGEGFLKLTDRKKNLLKTAGGKYVAPARLECLVKEEPIVSQVYVHGDLEKYVVALITLDDRETDRVAEELGVSVPELPDHPDVLRRVDTAISRANARLARFEQIKRHAILQSDFSIEDGTLTPTLKIKRRAVAAQYADTLSSLYQASP